MSFTHSRQIPSELGNFLHVAGVREYHVGHMAIPAHTLSPVRRRGNPNWGKPILVAPRSLTEFEIEARRLGLSTEMYVFSNSLRRWCEHNRNRVYIPEWLLKKWAIVVDVHYGWTQD